jgi:hypothetical protein
VFNLGHLRALRARALAPFGRSRPTPGRQNPYSNRSTPLKCLKYQKKSYPNPNRSTPEPIAGPAPTPTAVHQPQPPDPHIKAFSALRSPLAVLGVRYGQCALGANGAAFPRPPAFGGVEPSHKSFVRTSASEKAAPAAECRHYCARPLRAQKPNRRSAAPAVFTLLLPHVGRFLGFSFRLFCTRKRYSPDLNGETAASAGAGALAASPFFPLRQ